MPKPGYKLVKLFPRYNEEEIPEDWSISNIENMIKIIDYRGRTPPFSDTGILHLRSNNIRNGSISLDDVTFVTEKTYDEYMTRGIPQENDVLFTTEGPLGEVASVPKNFRFSLAQRIIVLRPKNQRLDSNFLKYILQDRKVKSRYEGLSTGTTLGGIASKWFTKILVPFPKLVSEQQKIGSILSNVDELISSYDDTIQATKKLKQGLMQHLITKGIGHKKFKKVKWLFGKEMEIPEEWEVKSLADVSKIVDSRHFTPNYVEKGFPLILPNNVTKIGLNLSETKFTTKEDYEKLIDGDRKPEKNDIIYSRNASFGVANQIKDNSLFSLGQDLVIIKPKKMEPYLLFTILNSNVILDQLTRLVTGSTFKRINVEFIRSFLIPYSNDSKEQQKIAFILSSVDDEISKLESKKTSLDKIKKGLIQKLLTGQIRVNK